MPESKLKQNLKKAALVIVLTLGLLVFIEGLASTVLFVKKFNYEKRSVINVEEKHTVFDDYLGWVNIPNLHLKDFYGPGKSLTINNLGFRGTEDVTASTTLGKERIICSGDSYALGYGVDDNSAWCALLSKLNPKYETLNMGQGGYGIDQAFLWYERDGKDLPRQIHILGYIGHDFIRMQHTHFRGYSKPVIEFSDGKLVVTNAPLKPQNLFLRWVNQNGYIFNNLRVVELINLVTGRDPNLDDNLRTEVSPETWDVLLTIFDQLNHDNQEKNSEFIMIYLPSPWDYETDRYGDIRQQLKNYSEESGVVVIDFVEKLRAMKKSEADKLFFTETEAWFPHLNEAGNKWVAEELLKYLEEVEL